ncbi:MAG: hypothetical protein AVDCRST_MAG02-2466 [uncultured Rubrobacteraceae bacterium]|uniref:Uncharacterized protein n=1 Tax=uncultured Rubrobacteraceae bacterium TaxID=349277 RepID=A0A6J4QY80_9ACTN|nr:MAG: hypothetical protein AVDCRST_MAG02-2466 [uncultured Rubrobacteraceae bacterium]
MRPKEGNGTGASTEVSFVWPIAAGKEEEWRRVLQELEGSRFGDYERMRLRFGIHAVRVWLQRTRCGELAVVHMEVNDPLEALLMLAGPEEIFEGWLKRKIGEFHGVDVARASVKATPELIFRTES